MSGVQPTPWRWLLLDEHGHGVDTSEGFESRGDAETWIGEAHPALVEDGIDAAQLVCDDDTVGAPLSLTRR